MLRCVHDLAASPAASVTGDLLVAVEQTHGGVARDERQEPAGALMRRHVRGRDRIDVGVEPDRRRLVD
jgi:hypothetical protein